MSGDNSGTLSILGLCNPLLDISAHVDQDTLDKYNLKPNNVILANSEHRNLCKELVEKYPVEYTAGGSAQNAMRVAAGIFKRQNRNCHVMFTGCIGNDEFGSLMARKAKEDGVTTYYSVTDTEPTGTCAVCLTEGGKNRSLCAFLGASQKFTDQYLTDNWHNMVSNTDIIYISGFLITVSPKSFSLLGEHIANCANKGRKFCLNLSAPYVSSVYGQELDKIMKYIDVIFGNDDEALAYAKHKNWLDLTNVKEIAKKMALDEKVRNDIGRLVIITQGERPVIVVQQLDGKQVDIKEFPCEPIPNAEMVDTNGAGDSFAGGFLSQYIQKAPIEHCIKVGQYAAREIIRLSGISVPDFADLPECSTVG